MCATATLGTTAAAAASPTAPVQPSASPSVNTAGSPPAVHPANVAPAPPPAKKLTRAQKQRKRAAYAVKYAYKQIGDPYRYGGTGPGSWDCSGLAGGAWRKAGVKLPRTTYDIYRAVKRKVRYSKLQPGDLVFFYSGRSHMGIYVGKGYMIHAPSSGKRVQKVKLSSYYKGQFNGAVRPGI